MGNITINSSFLISHNLQKDHSSSSGFTTVLLLKTQLTIRPSSPNLSLSWPLFCPVDLMLAQLIMPENLDVSQDFSFPFPCQVQLVTEFWAFYFINLLSVHSFTKHLLCARTMP